MIVAAQIAILIVAFVARAFFAGSETALVSAEAVQIEHLARSGNSAAVAIERLRSDRQRMIGSLLVGTNLTSVIATVLATSLTHAYGLFGEAGIVVTTILMILLILIFGEIIPKSYAASNALSVALRVAKPVLALGTVLGPIASVFTAIPKLFLRGRRSTADQQITEDSIRTMIAIGEEEGAVDEDEREMIIGMLDTGDTAVWEVMTPRVEMIYVAVDDTFDDVLDRIEREGFSRIPVYEDTVDNIIGVLHAKDVLPYCVADARPDIRSLLRPTMFVPESKRVSDLLDQMRKTRIHLAIVLDEYGGTAGLVTIEDLLEEIFGEIHDEYDAGEEDPIIARGAGSFSVDAGMSIGEVNEEFELALPDDEAGTIGGLVYSLLGRVPLRGERALLPEQRVELVAERVAGRRITRVRLNIGQAEARAGDD
ncbi:MAG: hemolysin family protein [Chloroflexota bacterium]